MSNNRLTATQLTVLERLVNSKEFIHRCSHTNGNTPDSYVFHGSPRTVVRADTVRKLLKLGLVEDFEDTGWRWRGSKYRVTDVGRSALTTLKVIT